MSELCEAMGQKFNSVAFYFLLWVVFDDMGCHATGREIFSRQTQPRGLVSSQLWRIRLKEIHPIFFLAIFTDCAIKICFAFSQSTQHHSQNDQPQLQLSMGFPDWIVC